MGNFLREALDSIPEEYRHLAGAVGATGLALAVGGSELAHARREERGSLYAGFSFMVASKVAVDEFMKFLEVRQGE